jgi:lipopolysaccharide export system protein LptA
MMREPKKAGARFVAAILSMLLLGSAGVSLSFAQNTAPAAANPPANAFQGFSRNRKDPVKIEANSFEVRDKEKLAIFRGNVVVVQGDTTMRCTVLEVHYEGSALGGDPREKVPATKTQQKSESAQRIKRLVATGGVIVTAKDQKAVGDKGIFEMASNIVILDGNVVLTQGGNVMNGDRLTVNLTTGTSKLDAKRVTGVLVPSSMDKKDKDGKAIPRPPRKKQPSEN